ncbi:hypothetical protein PG985_007231 [Apiospora marii]|uniref:Uncharacterized protein n=1 Tax=Apiospora marii TaxID=335849 RepID=A0ABR1SEP6_9PEZI
MSELSTKYWRDLDRSERLMHPWKTKEEIDKYTRAFAEILLRSEDPQVQMQFMFDQFFAIEEFLSPSTDQEHSETILVYDPKSSPPSHYRLTVSVNAATFLERNILEMRIRIEGANTVDGEQSRDKRIVLEEGRQDIPVAAELRKKREQIWRERMAQYGPGEHEWEDDYPQFS